MTALANRLLTVLAPAPVVVPAPAPAVPVAAVRAVLDPEVKFSGCVHSGVFLLKKKYLFVHFYLITKFGTKFK
jgi:hypothetical protein